MATRYAVPSSDNWDWGNTANWSASDGGAGGASVPTTGDTAILKQGAFNLGTSNLNQSAVTLAALYILGGYGGTRSGISIPTGANPLQISATLLTIQSERITNIHLSGAFTTIDCKQLRNGTLTVSGGSVTTFIGGNTGTVIIGDDVELTTFINAGMAFEIYPDATSAGDLDVILSASAKGYSQRKISTGNIDGDLTLKDAATIAISSGSTKVVVGSGGKLRLNNSGAMGIVHALKNSLITTKGTPGFGTPPTLDTLYYHEGANIDIPPATLTITTKTGAGFDFGSGPVTVI